MLPDEKMRIGKETRYQGASDLQKYASEVAQFYKFLRTGDEPEVSLDSVLPGSVRTHNFHSAGLSLHDLATTIRENENVDGGSYSFSFSSFPVVMKLSQMMRQDLFPGRGTINNLDAENIVKLRDQMYHIVPVIAVASYSDLSETEPLLQNETPVDELMHDIVTGRGSANIQMLEAGGGGYVRVDTTCIGNMSSIYAIQAAVTMYAKYGKRTYLRFIPIVSQSIQDEWLDHINHHKISDREVGLMRESFFKFGGSSLGMSVCAVLNGGSSARSWVFNTGHTDGPMKGISHYLKLQHHVTQNEEHARHSLRHAENAGMAVYSSMVGGAAPDDILHIPDYILPKCVFVVKYLNCPIIVPHSGIFSQSSDALELLVSKIRTAYSSSGSMSGFGGMPSFIQEPLNLLYQLRSSTISSMELSAPSRFLDEKNGVGIFLATTACEQMFIAKTILQVDEIKKSGVGVIGAVLEELAGLKVTQDVIKMYKSRKESITRHKLLGTDPTQWQQQRYNRKVAQVKRSEAAAVTRKTTADVKVAKSAANVKQYDDDFNSILLKLFADTQWTTGEVVWRGLNVLGPTKPDKSALLKRIRTVWPSQGAIGLNLAKIMKSAAKKGGSIFDPEIYKALEENRFGAVWKDASFVVLLLKLNKYTREKRAEQLQRARDIGARVQKYVPTKAIKPEYKGNSIEAAHGHYKLAKNTGKTTRQKVLRKLVESRYPKKGGSTVIPTKNYDDGEPGEEEQPDDIDDDFSAYRNQSAVPPLDLSQARGYSQDELHGMQEQFKDFSDAQIQDQINTLSDGHQTSQSRKLISELLQAQQNRQIRKALTSASRTPRTNIKEESSIGGTEKRFEQADQASRKRRDEALEKRRNEGLIQT